ncbi:MAG TPA: fibronectin type III domain-containing protein [Candidatus Deferrimicrobiaceae bacterium]|nr:fibronectin type III domain-containing protein [Candidatus Deferrimicrobiaceae bacterium]
MRLRPRLASLLAVLLLATPGLVVGAQAATVAGTSGEAAPGTATPPKVVIVVGATHEYTSSYRRDADGFAQVASDYGANVVKVYSPNATWRNVKAAAQGASILIYLGHGSGYPRYDDSVFNPDGHDGMGLNKASNPDDYVVRYYGESYVADQIRLARNAVVILSHLCYASGNSESGDPEPSYPVARQRIDNFASGFLRAGARAVIADVWDGGVEAYLRDILSADTTIGDMWRNSPSNHGHQMPFVPARNPAYEAIMDPNTWTSGFYRSIVGNLSMTTGEVRDGADAPFTSAAPEVWSVDGADVITPNFDGLHDRLDLVARFSETATWTARVRDTGGTVLRSQSGVGHQAFIGWDALVDGDPASVGDYSWELSASAGGSGDPTASTDGTFSIVPADASATAVLAFAATSGSATNSSTVEFALTFAGEVSGLGASDFVRTGSAAGCVIGTPSGAGSAWVVPVTKCKTGTLGLTLSAESVTDVDGGLGPAGWVSSETVRIDLTAPTTKAPKAKLVSGQSLASAARKAAFPVRLRWAGSDSGGAGLADYDVAWSVNGSAWTMISSHVPTASLELDLKPGTTYRFRVRARDKAGNVGAWAAGPTVRPKLVQQTSSRIVWRKAWSGASDAGYSGGSVRHSATLKAKAIYTFKGRSIGFVTTFGPDRGSVKVVIDGTYVTTLDLSSGEPGQRVVAFSRNWKLVGTHTIKLVVRATSGHPRVDVDAFAVLR